MRSSLLSFRNYIFAINLIALCCVFFTGPSYGADEETPLFRTALEQGIQNLQGKSMDLINPWSTTGTSESGPGGMEMVQALNKTTGGTITCHGVQTCNNTQTCNWKATCNGKITCNGASTCNGVVTCHGTATCDGSATCTGANTCNGTITCNGSLGCIEAGQVESVPVPKQGGLNDSEAGTHDEEDPFASVLFGGMAAGLGFVSFGGRRRRS